MVEVRVDEEASTEDAVNDVLLKILDIVEAVLSAAVSAATMDGLLLAATDAEDDAAAETALALTASTLEEAKGYAGTVSVLGNGGTDGTDGKETLGTAGTDGTEGRASTTARVGSTGADGTDACEESPRVDGSIGCVSDGNDAAEGI